MATTAPTTSEQTTAVKLALGHTKSNKFSLVNSQIVWTEAHMDTTKDRKKVRLRRIEKGKVFTRYVKPHSEIIAQV